MLFVEPITHLLTLNNARKKIASEGGVFVFVPKTAVILGKVSFVYFRYKLRGPSGGREKEREIQNELMCHCMISKSLWNMPIIRGRKIILFCTLCFPTFNQILFWPSNLCNLLCALWSSFETKKKTLGRKQVLVVGTKIWAPEGSTGVTLFDWTYLKSEGS